GKFTLTQETPFTVYKITVNNFKGTFVSSRNPAAGDWDPQLEVSGDLVLPVDLTGPTAEIDGDLNLTIPDEDGKRLLINGDGITCAADLSLDGEITLRLFNIVKVKIQNPSLLFDNTDKANPFAKFQAKLLFTPLQEGSGGATKPAVFDFSGKNY